ncbi:MAG: CvpA family protein [Acidobacteriota bacterium]|nr:CvpA family protein [Acidobacteriota bacterium]
MAIWNWVDWILAAIIVVSIVLAVKKGFVRELISLAAVVIGLIAAAVEYQRAGAWFEDLTKSHQVALACGFLAVFIGVLILGAIASVLARLLVKTAGVEWFDRFMGAVFGLVRGVIVDSILLMILMAFSIKPADVGRSHLAPYVSAGARVIAFVMPKDLKDDFYAGFQKFRQEVIQGGKTAVKSKASL